MCNFVWKPTASDEKKYQFDKVKINIYVALKLFTYSNAPYITVGIIN